MLREQIDQILERRCEMSETLSEVSDKLHCVSSLSNEISRYIADKDESKLDSKGKESLKQIKRIHGEINCLTQELLRGPFEEASHISKRKRITVGMFGPSHAGIDGMVRHLTGLNEWLIPDMDSVTCPIDVVNCPEKINTSELQYYTYYEMCCKINYLLERCCLPHRINPNEVSTESDFINQCDEILRQLQSDENDDPYWREYYRLLKAYLENAHDYGRYLNREPVVVDLLENHSPRAIFRSFVSYIPDSTQRDWLSYQCLATKHATLYTQYNFNEEIGDFCIRVFPSLNNGCEIYSEMIGDLDVVVCTVPVDQMHLDSLWNCLLSNIKDKHFVLSNVYFLFNVANSRNESFFPMMDHLKEEIKYTLSRHDRYLQSDNFLYVDSIKGELLDIVHNHAFEMSGDISEAFRRIMYNVLLYVKENDERVFDCANHHFSRFFDRIASLHAEWDELKKHIG